MRAAVWLVLGALAISVPAHSRDAEDVRTAMMRSAGLAELDREAAVDLLTVLAEDGLSPEDKFLVSLLAQDGRGPVKVAFKGETLSMPRPTYDAQRLMQRLLSPLDLTRLWLKGPESMADLRDLSRLSPVFRDRITAFAAAQLAETWDKGDSTRGEFRKAHASAASQFTSPGSSESERAQGLALLATAVRKLETEYGVTAPLEK